MSLYVYLHKFAVIVGIDVRMRFCRHSDFRKSFLANLYKHKIVLWTHVLLYRTAICRHIQVYLYMYAYKNNFSYNGVVQKPVHRETCRRLLCIILSPSWEKVRRFSWCCYYNFCTCPPLLFEKKNTNKCNFVFTHYFLFANNSRRKIALIKIDGVWITQIHQVIFMWICTFVRDIHTLLEECHNSKIKNFNNGFMDGT